MEYVRTSVRAGRWLEAATFDLGGQESFRKRMKAAAATSGNAGKPFFFEDLETRKAAAEAGGKFKDKRVVLAIDKDSVRKKYARVLGCGGAEVTDWREVAERRNLGEAVDLLISEPCMLKDAAFVTFLERNKGLIPYSFLYVADHITKVPYRLMR